MFKTREEKLTAIHDAARRAATWNVDGQGEQGNHSVLLAVQGCALSWDGEARIIGNVRAADIVAALDEVLLRAYEETFRSIENDDH
jgi:hypothetical protein